MTVTLSPEQLAEETDFDDESKATTNQHPEADVRELAVLLAQAFVCLPLFP
jgi:hypothetical protein